VKKVTLPKPVPNAAAVLNLFMMPSPTDTRDVFSHIPTVTGVVLPAKELLRAGADEGDTSAVDGAHVVGMMRLNLHELSCDMYSSSPHKWLQAPKGTGFLYVRDEVIDRLWNTIVTAGWDEPKLRADGFSGLAAPTCRPCGACARRCNWQIRSDGKDRASPPADGGPHFERDAETRGGVLDVA